MQNFPFQKTSSHPVSLNVWCDHRPLAGNPPFQVALHHRLDWARNWKHVVATCFITFQPGIPSAALSCSMFVKAHVNDLLSKCLAGGGGGWPWNWLTTGRCRTKSADVNMSGVTTIALPPSTCETVISNHLFKQEPHDWIRSTSWFSFRTRGLMAWCNVTAYSVVSHGLEEYGVTLWCCNSTWNMSLFSKNNSPFRPK